MAPAEEGGEQPKKEVGFAGMVDGYWLPKSTSMIRDHKASRIVQEHSDPAAIDELRKLQASTHQPSRIKWGKTKPSVGIEACPHLSALKKERENAGCSRSGGKSEKFESFPVNGQQQEGTRLICKHAPHKGHCTETEEGRVGKRGIIAQLLSPFASCFEEPQPDNVDKATVHHLSEPPRNNIHKELLDAITRVHQVDCLEQDAVKVFDMMLTILLDVTQSEYGFIGSTRKMEDGAPYLKVHVMSNICWTQELKDWFEEVAPKGLVFTNLNSLFGEVLTTGERVISNDPKRDPRSTGIPPGHPPLNGFLGVPLYTGTEMVGMFGIANRPGGYDDTLVQDIEPLTRTVAQMIHVRSERQKRLEAEVHLSSVVQAMQEGILTISEDQQVTSMNRSACRMFGIEGAALSMKGPRPSITVRLSDLLTELDGNKDFVNSSLEVHAGQMKLAMGRRRDGQGSIPLEVSISKGFNDARVFYVAIVRDISEKLEAQAKLKESEERWLYALSGSDDGVWDWNIRDNVLFCSDSFCRMFGFVPGELEWSMDLLQSMMRPESKEYNMWLIDEHLGQRTTQYVCEQEFRCKDGSYKWVLCRGKVISRNDEGEALRFVGTTVDITKRKEDERALILAKESAERASKAKADFLATMSHEIRTPMNGVIGMTAVLLDTELTLDQRDKLVAIRESGDVLLQIINDILDYSKIESGKLEMERSRFNVVQAVQRVVDMLILNAESKGLEMAIEITPNTPEYILGDAGRTCQVLINLVSNSIKFTDKGFVLIKISEELEDTRATHRPCDSVDSDTAAVACSFVSSSSEESAHESERMHTCDSDPSTAIRDRGRRVLVLSVSDSGIGIPADQQDRLFKHFTQVDASTTRRFGGTGLGLAISKQLVELMGGTIGFTSQLNSGTTFTVKLPLLDPPTVSDGEVSRVLLASEGSSELGDIFSVPGNIARAKMLVVGPCEMTNAVLSKQLKIWGVTHTVKTTAPEPVLLSLLRTSQGADTKETDGLNHAGEDCLLSADFSVLCVDWSQVEGTKEMDRMLGHVKDLNLGTVLLVKKSQKYLDRLMADCSLLPRKPELLNKPMVRPKALVAALEAVLKSPNSVGKEVSKKKENGGRMWKDKGGVKKSKATFKGRILLVEDNHINQKVAQSILMGFGLQVEVANNGLEALTAVQRMVYDLILMDCQMPEMDGWTATQRIRELEGKGDASVKPLPIVALTANALKGDRERCLEAGMTDYLSKPVSKDNLERILRCYLTPAPTGLPSPSPLPELARP